MALKYIAKIIIRRGLCRYSNNKTIFKEFLATPPVFNFI